MSSGRSEVVTCIHLLWLRCQSDLHAHCLIPASPICEQTERCNCPSLDLQRAGIHAHGRIRLSSLLPIQIPSACLFGVVASCLGPYKSCSDLFAHNYLSDSSVQICLLIVAQMRMFVFCLHRFIGSQLFPIFACLYLFCLQLLILGCSYSLVQIRFANNCSYRLVC